MAKNGVENTNFKGFMVDNAQANWNVVEIVYGSANPKVPRAKTHYTLVLSTSHLNLLVTPSTSLHKNSIL
jgi:hypothetical protein